VILQDILEFATLLPPNRSICGLDLGDKTIGVAISDLRRLVATPITVIRREKFTLDAAALLTLLTARDVAGIVLGLPLNMDGTDSSRTQSVRAFARNVAVLGLPLLLWDERWSTAAVERAMIAEDLSRARRSERVDRLAASYILQGAIDALAR